jgi:hypothetical protein
MIIETEEQFSSLPTNEEIALWEREADAEAADLREFDRELG